MNILNKITIKNIKLNKKRNIGTIIGILLSTALICAVAGMVTSFHQTLVQNAINETGYYHIELEDISNEKFEEVSLNRDMCDIKPRYELGYSLFEHNGNKNYPYIKVMSLDKENFDNLAYNITEGRLPTNANEIVVNQDVLEDSNYKIGDTIELNVGTRKTSDGWELNETNPYVEEHGEYLADAKTKTYKIVGSVYRESDTPTLYYGITTQEKSNKIDAFVTLENPRDYKNAFVNLLGAKNYEQVERHYPDDFEYQYSPNRELLRWEAFSFSDSTLSMITSLAGVVIVIIIITSVFCIRNSFAISTTEKMKMYGMLASVGATKKQIKKSVLFEGAVLGLVGIPLGIISGILAVFVIVNVVNSIVGDFLFNSIEGIVFKVSIIPVLISMLLGYVTIYFSCIAAAKRASNVSPIENLRNTKDIKMNYKSLKTPKIISKIFKTGGVLAHKNLKRSKAKYRTTVISLTVSIFVFISMAAFVNEGERQIGLEYKDYDYNFKIYSGLEDTSDEVIEEIKKMDNIEKIYTLYSNSEYIKITDMSKVNTSRINVEELAPNSQGEKNIGLELVALDDYAFKEYAKKINLDYDTVKEKGILLDEYNFYDEENNKTIVDRTYLYKNGDVISGKYGHEEKQVNIEIAKVTNIRAYGLESRYYEGGYLIVNKDYYKDFNLKTTNLLMVTPEPDTLEEELNEKYPDLVTFNVEAQKEEMRSMMMIFRLFFYGFITVITLIGVTNIFNTITSNMELRQKEFAMLKSIGMTKKEFNRMINLETLFYSSKSLIYGLALGILGALAIHKAFGVRTEMSFSLPYSAILLSIIFVFALVYIIMKYSIGKINNQNIIETIRNDNI